MKVFIAVLAVAVITLTVNIKVNGQVWDCPVDVSQYFNWFEYGGQDRTFYYDTVHLGEDSNVPEQTPVRAIGNGMIMVYKQDGAYPNGFGELYAVIKHDLGREYEFVNGLGQIVETRYICSVYGHIRKSAQRDGTGLTWKVGDNIQQGGIIGYINDDLHNGDGGVHLHTGIVLDWNAVDSYGYDYAHDKGHRFTAASEAIATLNVGLFPLCPSWQTPMSPAFLNAYQNNGGYEVLGPPWANPNSGPKTKLVHQWPDDRSYSPALWVQDFLTDEGIWSMIVYNPDLQQAFVVSDQILEYWTSNWGYKQDQFGPPLEDEENKKINGVLVRGQRFKANKTIYYQDDGTGIKVITSDKVSSAVSHGYGGVGPGLVSIATRPVADIQPLRGAPVTYNYRDFKLGLFIPGTLNGPYPATWPARRGFPFSPGLWADSWLETSWPTYARNTGDKCLVGRVSGTDSACDLYSAHVTPMHEGLNWPIKQGLWYRVEFEARIPASSPLSQRNLIVALTKPNVCTTTSEWPLTTNLVHFGSRKQFVLTKEWQRFAYEFQATGTEKNATIRFFFGDQNGEIVLDNLYFDFLGNTGQKLDLMVQAKNTWQGTYDTNLITYGTSNYCNFSATYPPQHPEAALGFKTTALPSLNFQPYLDNAGQIICYLNLPASIPYLDPKLATITFYWGQNPSNCYWLSTSQDLFGTSLASTPSGSPYYVWVKANLPKTTTSQKTGQPNPSQITYFEIKLTLNNTSYSFSSGNLFELYLIQ